MLDQWLPVTLTIKPNSLPRPQVRLAHCYLSNLIFFCSPPPSLHLRHHVLFMDSPDTSGICLPQGLGTCCSFHPTAWWDSYSDIYIIWVSLQKVLTTNVVTSQWRNLTDTTLTKASVTPIGGTEKGRSFLGIPAKNSLTRTRKHEAATPNGGTFCKITALPGSFQPDNWMQHVSLDWVTSQEMFFLLYTRTCVWPLVHLIKSEKSAVSLFASWPWSLDCGYVRERSCYRTDTHTWGEGGSKCKTSCRTCVKGRWQFFVLFLN